MNIYIESYGCSASQNESEIISGLLEEAGFRIVENEKAADLTILVTCYVKNTTEQKIIYRLGELQKNYPEKKLIISGCMPEGIYWKLVKIAPNASLVSTHHVKKIVEAVKKTLEGRKIEFLGKSDEVKLCLPKTRKNPVIGIVPISSGCNSNCNYCCVRIAKGNLFSYPKEKILKEVSDSVNQGCKEIWITSQDNASYGNGKLPELMKDISRIPGKFLVRIGMMNPNNVLLILPDLIQAYRSDKIYNFLHLPVQSGDNEVLRRMNRAYYIGQFESIVKEFRDNLRCQVWTDVIVGFPGETEEQFNNTLELVKRMRPDWVNVSKYGTRPNTPASKMEQLDPNIVIKRSAVLSKLSREITLENNRKWVGWEGEVLFSKKGKGENQWIGRNFAYKPVLIEETGALGKFLRIRVIKAGYSYLFAETV
ncbi:MAG: tRNA (N(6)-L-threonylcarbamoyladenosine(37)-C(2))-methylthiotransferase [Candidatus Aenigmatarchaeota archaeon]